MSDNKKPELKNYVVTRKQPLNINNRFIPEGDTVKLTERAAANFQAAGWIKPAVTSKPAAKPAVKKTKQDDATNSGDA